ncbi:MAG: redoxin family protein [Phycisphaerales bacterium]|nr:redoxin family protein [Phycisphaerales bacterium]
MKSIARLAAIALVAGLAVAVHAEPDAAPAQTVAIEPGSLTVGNPAPALNIAKWVKNSPVNSFQKGKVYVEFWATWCGPCVKSMPHLSSLQKEYADKGVTIIGVTSEDPRNNLEGVEKMVAAKGDPMGYTVAWDSGRSTSDSYMTAAAQSGIPTAFIVDQNGVIAWIGSPFVMDEPLEKIVAGKWDIDAARSAFEADRASDMAQITFSRALKSKDAAKIIDAGPKLMAFAGQNPGIYNYIAWGIVDPGRKLDLKSNPKLVDLALDAAQKADNATGNDDPGILDTLARVYFVKGDTKKAIEIQEKAIKLADDEKMKAELEGALKEYKSAK